MEKINFVNNSEPYLSAENLNQMQDNIKEAVDGIILYEDNTGTAGEISFTESLANYKYIDIYGYDTVSSAIVHKRVLSPGTSISHFDFGGIFNAAGVNVIALKCKRYNISEYKLTPNQYGICVSIEINLLSNALTNNRNDVLYITKVVGYK